MTVKELIELLQAYPADAPVGVVTRDEASCEELQVVRDSEIVWIESLK